MDLARTGRVTIKTPIGVSFHIAAKLNVGCESGHPERFTGGVEPTVNPENNCSDPKHCRTLPAVNRNIASGAGLMHVITRAHAVSVLWDHNRASKSKVLFENS